MGRVEGKIALVTGGASGLGRADCLKLAAEGARVIVTDVDEAGAEATARAAGNGAAAMRHDVSSEQDWLAVYAMIGDRFGGLDILVNNAGIVTTDTIETTRLDSFRKLFAVHAEGTFLGCQHGIPLMAASGGGAIVNMSSTSALQGYAPFFAYAGAKGAIRAMSRSIAIYCQDQGNGIRCNTVFPAGIETPMLEAVQGRPGEPHEVPGGVLPAGALGAPEDVAAVVLFLASDEARFLTGGEFIVDNGACARA